MGRSRIYGSFQERIRSLVLENKTDDEIREHFHGSIVKLRINQALRIVRDDLNAQRSTLRLQHHSQVIEEHDGERFVEFAPGHIAKESALQAIKSAKRSRA
jgi:hypothetical protein